jgi:hypothetical protein
VAMFVDPKARRRRRRWMGGKEKKEGLLNRPDTVGYLTVQERNGEKEMEKGTKLSALEHCCHSRLYACMHACVHVTCKQVFQSWTNYYICIHKESSNGRSSYLPRNDDGITRAPHVFCTYFLLLCYSSLVSSGSRIFHLISSAAAFVIVARRTMVSLISVSNLEREYTIHVRINRSHSRDRPSE